MENRQIKSSALKLDFSYDGKIVSLLSSWYGEHADKENPCIAFYLTNGFISIPLSNILFYNGKLKCASENGTQYVIFDVDVKEKYFAFKLEKLFAVSMKSNFSLRFELKGNGIKLTELDYMCEVSSLQDNLMRVDFPFLYHNNSNDPKGAFAIYTAENEDVEDEILLDIWVEQKLPHPNYGESWDRETAKAFVAEWLDLFKDRSQMMIKAQTEEELYEIVPYLEKLEAKQAYLFTDTWRKDGFWPYTDTNWGVNPKLFPNGVEDLRKYSDYLAERNIKTMLHYVSGGIGFYDPVYVGSAPDERLASWGNFTLTKDIDCEVKEIEVNPEEDLEVPYLLPSGRPEGIKFPGGLPGFFEYKYLLIEKEIVGFKSIRIRDDGKWIFEDCERGMFDTVAREHAEKISGKGLLAAYNVNFVPDNDSTLLDEVATGYANLINGARIMHTEYDGAEIHCYQPWGYKKFTQLVYQKLDHPVTAHDSSGTAPKSYYHYKLNCVKKTVKGDCSWGHINHHAHIEPYSHSRMATNAFEANHSLSLGHQGTALGVALPEPMFGESIRELQTHGDTERIINTVKLWKKACSKMREETHDMIENSFKLPDTLWGKYNHHRIADYTHTLSQSGESYKLIPTYVMCRKTGDIKWQYAQEHGILSPRQFLRSNEEITLVNPCEAQRPDFIVQMLWNVDENGECDRVEQYINQAFETREKYDFFQENNKGGDIENDKRPNLDILPEISELRDLGDLKITAPKKHTLNISYKNSEAIDFLDADYGAKWSIPCDLRMHRALAVTVKGDNSGAVLVIKAGRRDYAIKIDFSSEKTIVIPNGEASWYNGDWGWRMETKSARYEFTEEFAISLGYIPPKTECNILISKMVFLKESNLVARSISIEIGTGNINLISKGEICSGDIIESTGNSVKLYDKNWNFKEFLSIEENNFICEGGENRVKISVENNPNCFVSAQIISKKPAINI